MSIERLDKRIDGLEASNSAAHKEIISIITPIREKLFNGMSDSLDRLNATLPNLMTKEEYAVAEEVRSKHRLELEEARAKINAEMGKKKDRLLKAGLGIVPIVTGVVLYLLEKIV